MRASEFITETWPVAVAKWFDILRKSQKFKHLPDDKIQQMATRAAQKEVAPAQKAAAPKQSMKDRFNQHRQEMSDEEFQDYYGFGKWDESAAEGKQLDKSVVDAIQKVLPIAQEIWFHGSRATGKHHKDSDTDILVVVPDDIVGDQYLATVRKLQKLSSKFDNYDIQPTHAGYNIHLIAQEEGQLLWSKQQGVAENFADGKVKGKSRPGRVKKAGASCKGSVSHLRKMAKKYGGEKGKMYHWCLNMKAGKQKKK